MINREIYFVEPNKGAGDSSTSSRTLVLFNCSPCMPTRTIKP